MTTAADLIRRYWERCWNERALDELGEIFHERYQHNRSEATIADHAAIIEDPILRDIGAEARVADQLVDFD